jgi:conjugative transposon TraM protein
MKHTQQFLKKRKFLLMLPLLTIPFITMAFWVMDGGKNPHVVAEQPKGLNRELPGAQLDNTDLDKMSLYRQAGKDSADLQAATGITDFEDGPYPDTFSGSGSYTAYGPGYSPGFHDPNEARIRQRLSDLERIMNVPAQEEGFGSASGYGQRSAYSPDEASLQRLEKMMETMAAPEDGDQEVAQLSGMLERIIDIQHPERMREKLRSESMAKRGAVFTVSKLPEHLDVPLLDDQQGADNTDRRLGFFGLEEEGGQDTLQNMAIPAVIPETQTLVSGATLKMKLAEDVFIRGVLIPAGQEVYGKCSLEGERLLVSISGIRFKNRLFPVSLSVYGLDAMEGISIPGAITRDAAKESSDRTIQSLQFMNMDPSLGAQAAGAGIEAVRGLLSKKIKLIKVTVNAGLPVLLYDKQSDN